MWDQVCRQAHCLQCIIIQFHRSLPKSALPCPGIVSTFACLIRLNSLLWHLRLFPVCFPSLFSHSREPSQTVGCWTNALTSLSRFLTCQTKVGDSTSLRKSAREVPSIQTLRPAAWTAPAASFRPPSPDALLPHAHILVPAAPSSPSTLFLLHISYYLLKFYSSLSPRRNPISPVKPSPTPPGGIHLSVRSALWH